MQPPARMLKRGISALPTMGDGRQSGTSGSPSILNVSPEAAVGGGLALLKTGDRIRIDLNTRRVDVLLPDGELDARRAAWTPPELDQQDAVGGDLPQHGRPAGHRRVPGACDGVPQRHRDPRREPQQPLGVLTMAGRLSGKKRLRHRGGAGNRARDGSRLRRRRARRFSRPISMKNWLPRSPGRRSARRSSTCCRPRPSPPPCRKRVRSTSCSTARAIVHQGTVLDATEEEWAFAFDLNVRSMFRTIRAVSCRGCWQSRWRVDRQHVVGCRQHEGCAERALSTAPARRR